jgi:hypothetical protein
MAFEAVPWPLAVLWGLWIIQAAWAVMNQFQFLARVYRWDRYAAKLRAYTPPLALIVPVKDAGPHLKAHFRAIVGQRYPGYRVIFAVESEADPAFAALDQLVRQFRPATDEAFGCAAVEVVVAGRAEDEGQKVHNQRRALDAVGEEEQALVFADADAVPGPDWLWRLLKPMVHSDTAGSTGYRWLVPADATADGWATAVAGVINSSIATLMGPPRRNRAWGGSMAVKREPIPVDALRDAWRGALSDDYQVSRLLRRSGKKLRFLPRNLIVSPARFTWRSLLEFGRRQYLITRVHAPLLWALGLGFMTLYLAGWVAALGWAVVQGSGWGWGLAAAGLVYALDWVRGWRRGRVVREVLGDETAARLRTALMLDRWATPLWMAVHWACILDSAVGRRITWAGITYELRGPQDVKIIQRRD